MKIETDDEHEARVWMQQFAELPGDSADLPDPQLLWWKGKALKRLDAERRARAALLAAERIQIASSIGAAIVLLISLLLVAPSISVGVSDFTNVFYFIAGILLAGAAIAIPIWNARRVDKP